MKKILLLGSLFLTLKISTVSAQDLNWQVGKNKIPTVWVDSVNPTRPLPEYPRPQMVRSNWINLNGLWDYSIVPKTQQDATPTSFDGKILVPFAVESALSGVGKTVGKDSILWYKRQFTVPSKYNKQNMLLHFGAVDWLCDVFINGKLAGTHQGGYDPFSIDITPYLKKGSNQELVVRVWDPTDDGPQPRGKQVKRPNSIWYTAVTGIWQTVWLEPVPTTYIVSTRQTPDIDKQTLTVSTNLSNLLPTDKIRISAWDGTQKISEQLVAGNSEAVLQVNNAKLWSPETPHLYDLKVSVIRNNKVVDEIKSYFAMRKISVGTDANGVKRILLNNQFVFQYGPLDQGWWPEGLYTAPTDDALKFDIVKTKEFGFNMIRKHVKTEPARWYTYCDQMGMLVWQDMPSGDLGARWESRPGIEGLGEDMVRTDASEAIYRKEWIAIMDAFYNFPCIVIWTPFNEAWGQFKTEEISEWTAKKDPTRLINSASGGNFYSKAQIMDLHNYPSPAMPSVELFGTKQALVLGEFGGLGLPLDGHTWQDKNNWGYQNFKSQDELYARYATFIDRLPKLIKRGLSAAVYTQTTDVEVEVNGLMTYDRKVIKMPADKLRALHSKLYDPSLVTIKASTAAIK
ncbi:glycoside hydrolase family 2 protein [Segetibacter aerophilus]|uniref:Beta-galactosidase n=1 Tax=Segetibacter aerophilus TaxID=670293 RepID=A0A512BCL6_9BACT|nr:sugar-binding domain-containing protein [Segetibacter aerophilus]GEO09607.1 beta-galactosidase [Segetibacter aerophilus]